MNRPLSAGELAQIRETLQSGSLTGVFIERSVGSDIHTNIIMNDQLNDFDVVWQAGRLLDERGYTEDARFYLERATELEPENPKALARLIKHYLKLHEMMPNRGYNDAAYGRVCALLSIEKSDFSNDIYKQVCETLEQPEATHELVA